MQHEALEGVLLEEQILALHIFFRAERAGGKGLRFAAGEKRRAVSAGQNSRFARDFADLVEGAGIGTAATDQHIVAEDALAQAFEAAGGEFALLGVFFGNRRDNFRFDGVYAAVAFRFWILGRVAGIAELFFILLPDLFVKVSSNAGGFTGTFRGFTLSCKSRMAATIFLISA